jgi:two-component system LytT family response regulator
MIGQRLSHYEIVAEIGRGGMSVVYRARDLRLEREVALKILSPDRLADPELRRRFVQEARAAAAVQHPNVAVVHEIDEAESVAFIAMELIRGERLSDTLRRGALPAARALDVAVDVAQGLAEAHQRGIVHRDLKPANVVVTDAGHVKIIDFGVAKLLDPLGTLGHAVETPPKAETDPGRIIGTASYMSPEQLRGERVDTRSDIFSFGVMLHETLTGVLPFRRETAVETLHAILKERAPRLPPLSLPGEGELQRILDKCLEKDPEARYQGLRDLIVDLRAVRRGLDAPAADAQAVRPRGGRLGVVIVDDEELARRVLREYLSAYPDVEVLAECTNGFEAVKAVVELKPDLLLLDVQMPKLTGFEVLELIDRDVGVVFVTAYDEYALKAFEVHAIDYLLKPVSPERLAESLGRARERRLRGEALPAAALATAARPRSGPLERILVRQGPRVHVIPAEKLDYAEAQDDYVSLRSEGKEYLKQQTLAELEAALDPARFVRIHRSYVLNVERLAKLELYAKDSRVAILRDGTRLPVSRAGYARLKDLL